MQRHGRLTAAGLTALHSSPWRIDRDGPRLLHEVEASYAVGCERGPAPVWPWSDEPRDRTRPTPHR